MPSRLGCPVGERFGKLVVIGQANTKGPSIWRVRCDCGVVREASSQALRRRTLVTCGKCRRPLSIGQRFGKLTVVGQRRCKRGFIHVYIVRCACGNTTSGGRSLLESGELWACGPCRWRSTRSPEDRRLATLADFPISYLTADELDQLDSYYQQRAIEIRDGWSMETEAERRGVTVAVGPIVGRPSLYEGRLFDPWTAPEVVPEWPEGDMFND